MLAVAEKFNAVKLEDPPKHSRIQTSSPELIENGAASVTEKSNQAVEALEQMTVSSGAVSKFKKKDKKKKKKKQL